MKKTKNFLKFILSPKVITEILRITLWIAMILSILQGNGIIFFVILLTLALTYVNIIFEKYEVIIPPVFEFIIVFFIYSSLFLGDLNGFYVKFWWWDIVLHSFAGLSLGFIGFLILYTSYKTGKLKASPFFIAMFGFCFAVALGGIWEIIEFGVDSTLTLNMQKSRGLCDILDTICDSRLGVIDTMYDLILDTIGALIASVFGYFYLKGGEKLTLVKMLIERFEKYNESLFKIK